MGGRTSSDESSSPLVFLHRRDEGKKACLFTKSRRVIPAMIPATQTHPPRKISDKLKWFSLQGPWTSPIPILEETDGRDMKLFFFSRPLANRRRPQSKAKQREPAEEYYVIITITITQKKMSSPFLCRWDNNLLSHLICHDDQAQPKLLLYSRFLARGNFRLVWKRWNWWICIPIPTLVSCRLAGEKRQTGKGRRWMDGLF